MGKKARRVRRIKGVRRRLDRGAVCSVEKEQGRGQLRVSFVGCCFSVFCCLLCSKAKAKGERAILNMKSLNFL